MRPQLTKHEDLKKNRRLCNRCDGIPPFHYEDCPTLKEKTPKPWKKHNNRSNRTPEETDDGE